jgi:hypothetical protein
MGDSGAGATTLLVSLEADEISAGPADSLSSIPVCVGLARVKVLGSDGVGQSGGVRGSALASLRAAAVWGPPAGPFGVT